MTKSTLATQADNSPPINKSTIEARALSTADASHYTNHSEAFLKKARCGKTKTPGPRFRKFGKRVFYFREDLDAWLEQSAACSVLAEIEAHNQSCIDASRPDDTE